MILKTINKQFNVAKYSSSLKWSRTERSLSIIEVRPAAVVNEVVVMAVPFDEDNYLINFNIEYRAVNLVFFLSS